MRSGAPDKASATPASGTYRMTRTLRVHAFVDQHGRVPLFPPAQYQAGAAAQPAQPANSWQHQAALTGVTTPAVEIGANRCKPGTVDAAVVGYQSLTFRNNRRRNACVVGLMSASASNTARNRSAHCPRVLVLMLSPSAAARGCRGSTASATIPEVV